MGFGPFGHFKFVTRAGFEVYLLEFGQTLKCSDKMQNL